MRIFTITCHDCYNYGASLQAYALQQFLILNGHDSIIIDYIDENVSRKYQFTKLKSPSSYLKKNKLLYLLVALIKHRKEFKYWKRKLAFDSFTKSYLHLTPIRFKNISDLINYKFEGDLFIVGSDQVWNTDMRNGQDPAFYLDFVHNSNKCISYAASFGISNIRDAYVKFVNDKLKNFKAISVREKTGVEILKKMGYTSVQVMDPVFLLPLQHWESLCKRKRCGRYLLLYYLGPEYPLVQELCTRIASLYELEIYAICGGREVSFADHNIINAGPIEFLEFIRDASFVVSTSFHATAFSVIFQKQFIVCPIKGQDNISRMVDFLNLLGLQSSFISCSSQKIIEVDYSKINLVDNISKSIQFLSNNGITLNTEFENYFSKTKI